jgi:hypothetical protein
VFDLGTAGTAQGASHRPRVTGMTDATGLVDTVIDTLSALAHVVGEETALMKDGKYNEALSREARKSELAGAYMKGLEAVKANAVALARFAPASVQRLKGAHAEFLELIEINQAVLATARAVSENIVRELARDATPQMKPQGYGPSASAITSFQRASSGPLLVSKSL